MMRTLLVYPAYPETFWSFRTALKFISRRAAYPPLGLVTVAALLPREWNLRLVDLNVGSLTQADLEWADLVMISAMQVQQASVHEVVARCKDTDTKIVAGGPHFTASPEEYDEIDHLVLNEAELTLPAFIEDLGRGRAEHLYSSDDYPKMSTSPVPRWDLIDMRQYGSMSLQYSRGCPYDCEFCDITALFGRRPRTKETGQVLAELDALCASGWKGNVFFVDDNFIGNRRRLKEELLPALRQWNRSQRAPVSFNTEASINLSDDPELMDMMVQAGFDSVFVGIETPSEEGLAECGKEQNRNRDLLASIRRMQHHGLQVQGGFILGFDSDTASIFERMSDFIQKSGIVTAMVGLLNAPKLSRLYRRLARDERIRPDWSGDNTDFSTNIVPRMSFDRLTEGYRSVLRSIYSHRAYYERIRTFLREYRPQGLQGGSLSWQHIKAFIRSIWVLGVREKGRRHYWGLLAWTATHRPSLIPLAVTMAIYGHHFRFVFRQAL